MASARRQYEDRNASAATQLRDIADVLDSLRKFGIVNAKSKLKDALVSPETCLKEAKRCLHLYAFHGQKWVNEAWFEPELERLRRRDGIVNFLISDSLRDKPENFMKMQEMAVKWQPTLQVRLFKHKSIFRILFIDDSKMLLSHYGHEVITKNGENKRGWESPQLIIEEDNEWSLVVPFRSMFKEHWHSAEDITSSKNPQETDSLTKRQFV